MDDRSPRATTSVGDAAWRSPFLAMQAERQASGHSSIPEDRPDDVPTPPSRFSLERLPTPPGRRSGSTDLPRTDSALLRASGQAESWQFASRLEAANRLRAQSVNPGSALSPPSSRSSFQFSHPRSSGDRGPAQSVRRLSNAGLASTSQSRPRKTLEDLLIQVPARTIDTLDEGQTPLAVPSATTQDITDLMTIRDARAQRRVISRQSAGPSFRLSMGPSADTEQDAPAVSASTRTLSNPAAQELREIMVAHDDRADAERGGFGEGRGLRWAYLMPTTEDASRAVQRNLAVYAEESDNLQSWLPLLKMVPTILGKMGVAIGADLLTLGISSKNRALIAGGASLIPTGILAVMIGMHALTQDMKAINPRRVPFTLAFSLIGMLLISTSVTISETDIGALSLPVRSVSAVVFGCGLTMLNTSLPLSFAYSEMVHGDTFRSYRNEAAFILWGIGLGLATGLTVSRGAPHDKIVPVVYPFGVAHAFAVLGIALATFGTCLVATNLQRQTGRLLALRTRLRQLAADARAEGDP